MCSLLYNIRQLSCIVSVAINCNALLLLTWLYIKACVVHRTHSPYSYLFYQLPRSSSMQLLFCQPTCGFCQMYRFVWWIIILSWWCNVSLNSNQPTNQLFRVRWFCWQHSELLVWPIWSAQHTSTVYLTDSLAGAGCDNAAVSARWHGTFPANHWRTRRNISRSRPLWTLMCLLPTEPVS